jgi:endonuclease YncB( thermonuclease family)|tara:strand:- start:10356 stop:10760 length:405 start_codon:yes stop_codon:yes gene_type:complete
MVPSPDEGDRKGPRIYGSRLKDCSVTDGDTIRCGDERIRLLGIDAPELPGHCRRGRTCAPGDPFAATRSMEQALSGELRIERFGKDAYGRTLGAVRSSRGDLSCYQLQNGQALYRADWDNKNHIADACPDFAAN